MTIQTTSSKAGPFTGNGVNTLWQTSFRIDQAADLQVIYTDPTGVDSQLDGTLYTATGFGEDGGVSVTYPTSGTPISASEKITLLRVVNYDQQISIANQGGFYPTVIERGLDRIVYQTQQIAERIGRAILMPISSTLVNIIFPEPTAGLFLRGRQDGRGFENADVTDSGSIGIPVPPSQGGTGLTSLTDAANAMAGDVLTNLTTGAQKATTQTDLEVIGQHLIPITAGGMNTATTNGAAPSVPETATNKVNYRMLTFIDVTQTFAWFDFPMPSSWDAGTVSFRAVWTSTAGSPGDGVVFGLAGLSCGDGDQIDTAPGARVKVTDTLQGSGVIHKTPLSTAVTLVGASAGDLVLFRVDRDPTDAGDTLAGDVQLLGIELLMTTSAGVDA